MSSISSSLRLSDTSLGSATSAHEYTLQQERRIQQMLREAEEAKKELEKEREEMQSVRPGGVFW
jgi:hypothetical protein